MEAQPNALGDMPVANSQATPNALGDMPVSISPSSTPAQDFLNKWNAVNQQAQIQSQGEPQSATIDRSMIDDIGAGLQRGILKGGLSIIGTGVNAYELSSHLFGGDPSNLPREFLNERVNDLDKLIPPTNSVGGSIAQGIGELPIAIATFMNPAAKSFGAIKLAATLGAIDGQQQGATGMLGGALSGAAQMAFMGKAQKMNVLPGMALGAATTAVPAILSDQSPQDITAQAVLGAGFAAWKPTTIKEVGDIVNNVRDIIQNPKERFEIFKDSLMEDPIASDTQKINDEMKNIKDSLSQTKLTEKESETAITGVYKEKLSQNEEILKQLLGKEDLTKVQEDNKITREISDSSNALKEKIDLYNNRDIPEEAFAQAKHVQRTLPAIEKQASEIYGKRYDAVAESIDKDSPITKEDATKLLVDASKRIVNDTADENDRVLLKVHQLLEGKYSSDPVIGFDKTTGRGVKLSDIEGAGDTSKVSGRISWLQQTDPELYQSYLSSKGGTVPFGDFHADLKRIWNSIPMGSEGSHSAGVLRHTFGDYITTKVPSFQALQDAYRPILDYHAFLNKVFQPMKTEANLEGGTNFLKQFAKEGGPSPVDRRVLDYLQHGKVDGKISEFSNGIGDAFMKEIGNLARRLKTMQNQYEQIADVKSAKLAAIAGTFTERVAQLKMQNILTEKQLENEKSLVIDHLQKEIARQRYDYELRENDLTHQKQVISTEKAHRESREGLFKALSLGIGSVWNYKITRAMMAISIGSKALRKSK